MARREKLTEEDIGRLAQAEIAAAVTYDGTDFQRNRVRALEYYRGEMKDLESEEGLSTAVSHDVQDVIGWILPGLMRVFFSTGELGRYEPENEEDEQGAKQATDYANAIILRECSGYEVFWDVFHDALLHANGVVKHWWETAETQSVHLVTGLDDDQWAELVNNPEIEVISHREDEVPADYAALESDEPIELPAPPMPAPGSQPPGMPPAGMAPPPGGAAPGGPPNGMPPAGPPPAGPGMNGGGGGIPPSPPGLEEGLPALMGLLGGGEDPSMMMPPEMMGPPPPIVLHSAKVRRTKKVGQLKIAAMPPEEFIINIQAKSIADARVTGHRMLRLRSELIEAGYDEDKVNDLPASNSLAGFGNLPQVRRDHAVLYPTFPGLDKSVEEVEVIEVYMKMDIDGDGVAEMVKIVMGEPNSNIVLDHELWEDDVPFTDFVAERSPHRWQGRSTFDDTEDIQRIKSTLLRQFLDNLYHANIPDRAVEIDRVSNPDSLIDRKIGNMIHTDGPPQGVIMDLQVPFVAKEALTGLEYMDQIIERRTGVSKATMALDLEALQNQSATAVNAAQSSAYSKIELIARNFAEMGFKRFFQCILKLIVAHQDGPRRIKIRKKWVTMDPASWNANMKFRVNVGLGSGSRDRDAQIMMQIAGKQEMINMQMGPDNPICSIDMYANTLRSLVKMALPGGEPDDYFNDVDPKAIAAWMQKQQQAKPDPKAAAEQQKVQIAQQKAQADIQLAQQKGQAEMALKNQSTMADMQARQQKVAADMQSAREKNAMSMQAGREKAAMQMQTAQEKAAQEAEQRQEEALLDAELKRQEMFIEAQLTREANRMNAANQKHKTDTNINSRATSNKGN